MTEGDQRAALGSYQNGVDRALENMKRERIMPRIWAHDHTVWKPDSVEIDNRLGWLHIAEAMLEKLPHLRGLLQSVQADGYTNVLLLGMGGSSLAPEVFRKSFGVQPGCVDLAVLDSTDPGAVLSFAEALDLSRTLFIVATKSGDTVETLSFFRYFFNRTVESLGWEKAGKHFIAITDPGSQLVKLAEKHSFRDVFLNDPDIGGRYSALSFFGLIPAILVGVDGEILLDGAIKMSHACGPSISEKDNPAAMLGAILGALAKVGRNKMTLEPSLALASFGDWIEQLIAESTGKEGQGILPVVGEMLGDCGVYGKDRWFVHLRLIGDDSMNTALKTIEEAGHPVVDLNLRNPYDLGGQFFLWELATAVAGHLLGINPFDQPNVESAKVLAHNMVAECAKKGALPEAEAAPVTAAVLDKFLSQAKAGDYIALQAYLQPSVETDAALQSLRHYLRNRFRLATTMGYGPRFLHSTGQLHKGDAGNGLFIQFIATTVGDLPIPDEAGSEESSISFGVLKMAQALGDAQALRNAGRRVLTFHLGEDPIGQLQQLRHALP